jgi:MFS superfamily sulfate permease-like transporter
VRLTPTPDLHLREGPPATAPCDRLLVYGLEGEVFFGTEPELARHFTAIELAAREPVRVVVLVLRQARNPDAAFLNLLQVLHGHLRRRDIALVLAEVQSDLRKALVDTGLEAHIGASGVFSASPDKGPGIRAALEHAYNLLGKARCPTCPQGQARECLNQPWDYVI